MFLVFLVFFVFFVPLVFFVSFVLFVDHFRLSCSTAPLAAGSWAG